MSDEKEDLELEALQRQLDDAFATTRPRRAFEDELWMRMQARRPLWTRVRDTIGSLLGPFRERPAIPLGAVAMLLVVLVGGSILLNSALRSGPHNSYSAGVAALPADQALGGEFGKLPTPALHPDLVDTRVPLALSQPGANSVTFTPSNLYFGPANLVWTGQLPDSPPPTALVYRYGEPGPAQADQFAGSLGAASTKQSVGPGFLGAYAGGGFTLSVLGSVAQLPKEPTYVLVPSLTGSQAGDPLANANAFLGRFSLAPAWPDLVDVQQSGDQSRVRFLRAFQLPAEPMVFLVDGSGERYGIEVDVQSGAVRLASGPLPLNLDSATYRLITNDQALRLALGSSPASLQAIQPTPTVKLDQVEEVYVLAVAKGQGFYEPAYLFSGTFTYNGQTYTKRVLVPLVDPTQRSS